MRESASRPRLLVAVMLFIVLLCSILTACDDGEKVEEASETLRESVTPSENEATTEASEQTNDSGFSAYMHKYYPGVLKETNKGYLDGEEIEKADPHFGWVLGRFYVKDFTRVIDGNDDNPIFLKTPGDTITLGFILDEEIDKLNGNDKLSIAVDDKGYDPYFESTEKSDFGKGALFIKQTDYQGNVIKTSYIDYLPAKTVGADVEINTYEEGDYEVALDYKVIKDGPLFFSRTYYYQLRFNFSVRNGNCMVYPRDISTTSELSNGDVAAEGFFIDLTKSRYLNIDVKKETLANGALDIRFNRPARDGEEYLDEGIYTITASNPYTNEQITKKICVGRNSALIEYFKKHQ